jgi:hypothetical protein
MQRTKMCGTTGKQCIVLEDGYCDDGLAPECCGKQIPWSSFKNVCGFYNKCMNCCDHPENKVKCEEIDCPLIVPIWTV